jgi:tellurite resistance protein
MYTLLPATKGITASMLLPAIAEMEQAYTGEHLRRHLRRFRTILRRSRTLSAQDKQMVENRMRSYDSLLESDPEFQQRMAESEVRGQQKLVLELVVDRFPA